MNEKVFKEANRLARKELTTLHRVVKERINKEKEDKRCSMLKRRQSCLISCN